jgi:hypothetical protein
MFSLVVVTCLSATLNAPKVEEVWEGTLQVEFVEQKAQPKRKRKQSAQPPRGKHQARTLKLTIRLTKEQGKFTGEWIEGDRSLQIAGTITKKGFRAVPTAVIKGQWNQDILTNLQMQGTISKGVLNGRLGGVGKNRARGGTFTAKKKE